jgi:hypothetical protein
MQPSLFVDSGIDVVVVKTTSADVSGHDDDDCLQMTCNQLLTDEGRHCCCSISHGEEHDCCLRKRAFFFLRFEAEVYLAPCCLFH